MDSHVEAARQAILAQIRVLDSERRILERILRDLDLPQAELSRAKSKPGRQGGSVVKPAIEKALRRRPPGAYAHATEILQELRDDGVPVSEKDPVATVVTALIRMRRDGQVIALGGNRWAWRWAEAEDGG